MTMSTLSDETLVSPKCYLVGTMKIPLFQLDDDAFFGIIQSFQTCVTFKEVFLIKLA